VSRIPKAIREQVRHRAEQRCEYCHKPEGISPYPHHVDHIISRKHGGSSELDNLAWACFQCNTAKSSDIASYDIPTQSITPLFHPRQQAWSEHFEFDGAMLVTKTAIGRATLQALKINEPEEVDFRASLIRVGLW
jgi:hypothetical protein